MALRPKIVKLIDKYSQKRGLFVLFIVQKAYYLTE